MPASISPTTLGWRNLVNRYPSNCARPTSNKRISRIEVKSEFDIRGAAPHRVGCGKQPRVWQARADKRWAKDSYLFGSKKTWSPEDGESAVSRTYWEGLTWPVEGLEQKD